MTGTDGDDYERNVVGSVSQQVVRTPSPYPKCDREPPDRRAVVASISLAGAIRLGYGPLGADSLPVNVVVQRILVVALGPIAGGATGRATRRRRTEAHRSRCLPSLYTAIDPAALDQLFAASGSGASSEFDPRFDEWTPAELSFAYAGYDVTVSGARGDGVSVSLLEQ